MSKKENALEHARIELRKFINENPEQVKRDLDELRNLSMNKEQQESRIDFETAKLAKDAGFDWELYYYYDGDGDERIHFKYKVNWNASSSYDGTAYESISRPTHAHIMKWLRDVHQVFVEVESSFFYDKFIVMVLPGFKSDNISDADMMDTWEQAEAAGIKSALEYVIENKVQRQNNEKSQ